jgi:hypothetical protein
MAACSGNCADQARLVARRETQVEVGDGIRKRYEVIAPIGVSQLGTVDAQVLAFRSSSLQRSCSARLCTRAPHRRAVAWVAFNRW